MNKACHVIVLGFDGLRPDMINAQTMPNLDAMRNRGVSCPNHRTVFPTETRGALTALACGARPETNGILGNDYYAGALSGQMSKTDTIHDWNAGEAELDGGMVTATSLSQALARQDKRFAVVTSSGQGSFTALNWKGASFKQIGFNLRHPGIAFPSELARTISCDHNVPPEGYDRGCEDEVVSVFTQTVWPYCKPDAAILWFTEVDSASHRYGLGSEDMLRSLKEGDDALGRLLEWRDAQPEKDDIAIIITSDHGHSIMTHFPMVDEAIKAAGISLSDRFEEGVDVLFRRGRAPGFWLRKPDDALRQAIIDIAREQEWFGACFTNEAEKGSFEGVVPGTLAIQLTGAAHYRAPDIYINLKGDDEKNEYGVSGCCYCDIGGWQVGPGGGSHGGMHKAELAAVMIAEGSGLKSGGEIVDSRTGIQDIAPTVLHLLGLEMPARMTGRPMHELLDNEVHVAAPSVETISAAAGGKTSQIVVTQLEGRSYVDEAKIVES